MHVVRRVYGLRTAFQEEGELIAREKEAEAKKMGLADPWQRREEMIVDLLESNIRAKRDRAIGFSQVVGLTPEARSPGNGIQGRHCHFERADCRNDAATDWRNSRGAGMKQESA